MLGNTHRVRLVDILLNAAEAADTPGDYQLIYSRQTDRKSSTDPDLNLWRMYLFNLQNLPTANKSWVYCKSWFRFCQSLQKSVGHFQITHTK